MTEAAAQLSGASIAEQKEQYIGLVNELNSLRDHIRGLDEILEIQINRLRESHRESYSESYETYDLLSARAALAESGLRQAIVERYQATGETTIDENLSVRVTRKLQYDNAKAVKWAEINAPVMVVKAIDKKAFESLPVVTDLDFVEVQESASAVIKGLPKPE